MKQNFSFSNRMGFSLYKEQREYLFSPSANSYRLRLLAALISLVADHDTEIKQERFHLAICKGQVVASEIELARIVGCNRKTIHIMLSEFENLGLTRSVQVANRTTVHTLYFISGWKDDKGISYNNFFDRNKQETVTRLTSVRQQSAAKDAVKHPSANHAPVDALDSDKTKAPSFNSPTVVEEKKEGAKSSEESTDSSVHTSGCHGIPDGSNNAVATSESGVSAESDFHKKGAVATLQTSTAEKDIFFNDTDKEPVDGVLG